MARATLTQRVEVLEHSVRDLAVLPGRIGAVERELKAFRADVAAEFGKVRVDIREGDEETRPLHARTVRRSCRAHHDHG